MPGYKEGIEAGIDATIHQLRYMFEEEGFGEEIGLERTEYLKLLKRLSSREEAIRDAAEDYHK